MVNKQESTSKASNCKAAEWFVRWDDPVQLSGAREQARWIAWLQRRPKNVQSYMEMDDMCERLRESQALKDFDVEAWLAEGRASVTRLQVASNSQKLAPKTSRKWLPWAAAASIAMLSLGVGAAWWLSNSPQTYAAGLGEQNTVRLNDGSVLQLNTQSSARVWFTERERAIELHGEGLFTVAHDPKRPFLVRTRDLTAQALGTRFNVYEHGPTTTVSVMEGAVRILSVKTGKLLDLNAGEAARVINAVANKVPTPDIAKAIAWQSRTLIFERTQLNEVAQEFNRYNRTQFQIDPAIGERERLSGTFDALHPQSFLLWLESRDDLQVVQEGEVYRVDAKSPR